MAIETKPFDAARYIDDTETQAELLSEVLATGDRPAIVHVLNTIARARGMSELARLTGIKRSNLYAALADDNNPSLDTFLAILKALELKLGASPASTEHEAAAAA